MDPMDSRPLRRTLNGLLMTLKGGSHAHRELRNRIAGVTALSIVVDVLAAGLAWSFEHGRGEITTIGDALFWTTTQMLTVSSQFPNPLTTGGKLLDVGLELYAVTVVTSVAGAFASFFHARSGARKQAATP